MSRSVESPYASPQISDLDSAGGNAAWPTSVRYRIIALSVCMSLLLYLDRNALSAVTSTIVSDLKINNEKFGWGTTIFFWAYALFQVPAGALADRFGARKMLAIYVIAWSLATIALGFVPGLIGLLLLRGVMGVAQAGAYPAAGSFLKRWTNPVARARANSLITSGGRLGAVAAFALTAGIGILFHEFVGFNQSWRATLVLYGTLGLVWTALFYWYFRDHPREHAGCNAAELHTIGCEPLATSPATVTLQSSTKFLERFLLNPNIWLLSLSGFLVNVGWIFLATWATVYILDAYSDQLQYFAPDIASEAGKKAFKERAAGIMTAGAFLCAILGGLSGGVAADILRRRFGPIWGRRIPGLISGTTAGCLYLVCHWVTDVWVFLALLALISFTIDFGLGALWATYQDIGGKYVGSVLGFANMWGNIAAGIFGGYYGKLADQDQWALVFSISAFSLFGLSACWLLVNPTRGIDQAEDLAAKSA